MHDPGKKVRDFAYSHAQAQKHAAATEANLKLIQAQHKKGKANDAALQGASLAHKQMVDKLQRLTIEGTRRKGMSPATANAADATKRAVRGPGKTERKTKLSPATPPRLRKQDNPTRIPPAAPAPPNAALTLFHDAVNQLNWLADYPFAPVPEAEESDSELGYETAPSGGEETDGESVDWETESDPEEEADPETEGETELDNDPAESAEARVLSMNVPLVTDTASDPVGFQDEQIPVIDAVDGTETYEAFDMYTILLEGAEQKGPEHFLGSHPGPSNCRIQGFPIVASQRALLPPKTQCTVPVSFEAEAIRPATDYMVEITDPKIAKTGVMIAKALIDGTSDDIIVPVINPKVKTAVVPEGAIVGWAFPLVDTDEIDSSLDAQGRPDYMPYRKVEKRPKAKSSKGLKKAHLVNSIAIEDEVEGEEAPPTARVSSDPLLKAPAGDSPPTPPMQAEFEKYSIQEESLGTRRK